MTLSLTPELPEYLGALERCRDTSQLTETVSSIFAEFGVEYFSIFETPRDAAEIQDLVLAAQFPEELYRLYREQDLFHWDPAMQFARRATSPFQGIDAPREPEQEWFANEWQPVIANFGIFNELYIPIVVPEGVWGDVWVSGRNFDPSGPHKWTVRLLAFHAFAHVRSKVDATRVPTRQLTQRETEVVTWTAHGRTAAEIAGILNITVRTVNEYAQSARRKLGAVNRAQMVAVALRHRLIEV